MNKSNDYQGSQTEVCEAFWQWVNKESCELIRQAFDDKWYVQARTQAQGVDNESLESFNGYYLPCRLYEEEQWELINQGLQIIDEKTGKHNVLRNKLMNLRQVDLDRAYDQAFELVVMSRFAVAGVLENIEDKPSKESGKNIDILLTIDGKNLYVEVARMAKNLRAPKIRVGVMSPTEQIRQVVNKIKGKVGQLHICPGPTILKLCLPDLGANSHSVRWALEEHLRKYQDVGAVVIYCRYRFRVVDWYINSFAETKKRLDNAHINYLEGMLGKKAIEIK